MCLLVAMAVMSVTSCKDDDDEDPILHENYIQGKLNEHVIDVHEVNADIWVEKSNYDFCSADQTDLPVWFDWKVVLVETDDTIITMSLHINRLNGTNEVIYSPNEEDPIKTQSTCYATVKDLKNNTASIYHPIHSSPISVVWKTFMLTADENYMNPQKVYYYKSEPDGPRWPGIQGRLYGTLTSDDESKEPLKIDMEFVLY